MIHRALFSEKTATACIFSSCFMFILASFFLYPYTDTYYYWDWSRHLALSYYDGPPMVAYLLRGYTVFFGNTFFALNFFGASMLFITAFFIYKIGLLLFDRQIALNAAFLWLVGPSLNSHLFIRITYDAPFCLFWASTLYFVVKYLEHQKTRDIYWAGGMIGLMLLSKYIGIILVLALFVFILFRRRSLLFNKHIYFSMLLAACLFSPVLIWNAGHQWTSFLFQLKAHSYCTSSFVAMKRLLSRMVLSYNFLFLVCVIGLYKVRATKKDSVLLLNITWILVSLFFLTCAFLKDDILENYFFPGLISLVLLSVYYIAALRLRKTFLLIAAVYLCRFVLLLIHHSLPSPYGGTEHMLFALSHILEKQYIPQHSVIMVPDWETAARLSFWLKNHPTVFVSPWSQRANQYAEWSQPVINTIQIKKIPEVFYVDFQYQPDRIHSVKGFLHHCAALQPLANLGDSPRVFVYRCRM